MPILRRRGTPDLLQWRNEQNCWQLKRKHVSQTWQLKPPSPMLCHGTEFYPKANMEPSWNNTSVFLGNDEQIFPKPLRAHRNSAKMSGTTYRFQDRDAADGTSFAPSDPGRSTRPSPSSKHHKYNKSGYENTQTRSKQKDLTTRLSPSSLRNISFK